MLDEARHNPSDTARQSTTRYSLSLDDVSRLFVEAGLPRNARSLQRYCVAGRLDCIKEETVSGLTYFVDPVSVEQAIKQLAQLHSLTDEVRHSPPLETSSHHGERDFKTPRPADTPRASAANRDNDVPIIQEGLSATESDASDLVALLERENTTLREEKEFYRDQIKVKDTQIAGLLERDKETNYLVRGLQTMLAPLLGRGANDDHGLASRQTGGNL